LIVLDAEDIQEKADREGVYPYLKFNRLNLQNPENAVVELWIDHAQPRENGIRPMGGGGFVIFYRNVSGNWKGKIAYTMIA